MHITKPSYYDRFFCLAGSCPDTCCGSWRVVIDPDSLVLYKSIGGRLGAQLESALTEEGGEPCFTMANGRCTLLTAEGLCTIQKELGEDALCKNCARYPRFITEIGARREVGISLSCPEAARLILTTPFGLCHEETDEPMTDLFELSPEMILTLRVLRSSSLDLARDRSLPFGQRCAKILRLCAPAGQTRRDRALAAALEKGRSQMCDPVPPADAHETERFFKDLRKVMGSLSYLQPAASADLEAALARPTEFRAAPPEFLERLLCYGIYKYFPRAAFDRSIWPTAVFCVTLPLLLAQVSSAGKENDAETFRRLAWTLSRELEHSEENMAMLFRSFRRGAFRSRRLPGIFAAIQG